MDILGSEQIQAAKRLISAEGRLLERQLFEYCFGQSAYTNTFARPGGQTQMLIESSA